MSTEHLTLNVTCPKCGASLPVSNTVDTWHHRIKAGIMPYCQECHHMWPLSEEAKDDLKKTLKEKTTAA